MYIYFYAIHNNTCYILSKNIFATLFLRHFFIKIVRSRSEKIWAKIKPTLSHSSGGSKFIRNFEKWLNKCDVGQENANKMPTLNAFSLNDQFCYPVIHK